MIDTIVIPFKTGLVSSFVRLEPSYVRFVYVFVCVQTASMVRFPLVTFEFKTCRLLPLSDGIILRVYRHFLTVKDKGTDLDQERVPDCA